MTSRKMIAKQIDFEDIFPQDISTCIVSVYIDQRNVTQEEDLRDDKSLDVLVNALQLDLIL
jgi:hypothetical protein